MNRKVTVVGGAGNVGATVARAIADKELADVVIIDIAENKAKGVALDMYEACPFEVSDSRVIGAGADEAGWKEIRAYLAIPDEFMPIGVMPVGRSLPDVRSPSLKRGWVPFDEFARWEGWS